ncbi:MAG: hypothetical protein JJU02_02300 [Cryomorphaceae bacterium]|nr:hypothetical protein [Cryomorphaceae bacterium]
MKKVFTIYKGFLIGAFSFFILLAIPQKAVAQSDLMLYNFRGVAQSSLLNPATRSQTRFSLGIFSNETSFHNTGFSAHDLMARGSNLNDNLTNILSNIGDRDFIRANNETHLMFTSFHISPRSQISFGTKLSTLNHLTLPVNLLRLIQGNDQEGFRNEEVQFGNFGFDFSTIFSYHLGLSVGINERLNIGVRGYRHHGLYNVSVNRDENDVRVFFGEDQWRSSTNFLARTSMAAGPIDRTVASEITYDSIRQNENIGYSLDLGFNYKLSDKWSISGSILGLGYINYTYGLREYAAEGDFDFDGIEVDLNSETGRLTVNTGEIIDTLRSAFNIGVRDGESYRRNLPTQVFVGAEYEITKRHRFNYVTRYTRWSDKNYFDFNVRYVFAPTRFFHTMASISSIQGKMYGGGAGVQFYLPGIQIFVMADIMSKSIYIDQIQGAFVNVGLNMAFWERTKKKKDDQEEIIENENQNL